MRLGGQVFLEDRSPERWVQALTRAGFRATPCPLTADDDPALLEEYVAAAREHDILISEVGAWSNPISPDPQARRQAVAHCIRQLELAERIGAACCLNIAGSRGEQWDGPHPDNFSPRTFDLIVKTVGEIIDAVEPVRTVYALEAMPWALPDSAESYLALLQAIDRPGFGVHFDPVNLVSSPRVYARNSEMIRDFFAQLGPHIRNCHAKDIRLGGRLTVHLDEVVPGEGALDYATFLTELDRLHPDTALIIEHLPTNEAYARAAAYIREVAVSVGVRL